MIEVIQLLLAHVIGDFVLQPRSWVEQKERKKIKSIKFYFHILLHGFLAGFFLGSWSYIWPVVLLTLAHGGIDLLKLYKQESHSRSRWFFIDQMLHLVSIAAISVLFFPIEWSWQLGPQIWVYATAIVTVTFVTSMVIRHALASWSRALPTSNREALPQAGHYIGLIERLLVFIFVLMGQWSSIGFLVAAKSVFRFGDLTGADERRLTEYILVGTLLSFGLAIAIGIGTLWVLGQLGFLPESGMLQE